MYDTTSQGATPGANNPWYSSASDQTTYGAPVGGSFLSPQNMGLDPDMTAAMQYLRSVMEGNNVPFTDAVKNQMLSQQSGMNAAAEAGQNQALTRSAAVGGSSGNDPSLRGAMRQSMAARQGANTEAAGKINTQATLANNQAQGTAGQQLAGWGNQREARLNRMVPGVGGGESNTQGNSPNASFLQMPSPTWM
jgi:hypothetical protein